MLLFFFFLFFFFCFFFFFFHFYRPSVTETNVLGDIKMGFMVSKGQLEIDIIVVKGLSKSGLAQPPGKICVKSC